MKKFYPVFLLLVLAALVAAVSYWRAPKPAGPVVTNQPPATEQQSQAQETQSSNEDISNWNIYRNEQYGFEFDYPMDWEISGNWLIRKSNQTGVLGIDVSITPFGLYPWFSNEFSGRKETGIPKYTTLSIADESALRFFDPEGIGGCQEDFVFIRSNIVYRFSRHPATCDISNELFDKIFSTFRFTKITSKIPGMDWKTYANDKLGYQVEFPNYYKFEITGDGTYHWGYPELFESIEKGCGTQIYISTTGLSLDDYIKDFRSSDVVDGLELNQMSLSGDYSLGGIKAKLLNYGVAEGTGGNEIFISGKDKNYVITIDHCDINFPSNVVSSILSTFKFTN